MTAILLASLWLAQGPVVTVESDAACPTARDVSARVMALLPPRETDDAPDVARLAESDGALLLTLTRPDGTSLGERALDRGFPCADLAGAAAVVIATWESDVHSEFRAAPLPARPEAAPPATPVIVVAVAPAPPRAVAASFDLGAALVGSLAPSSAGAGPALGALVVASWIPSRARVGVRLALGATTEREVPLGAGHVRWRRITPALGPALRLASATTPWALDLHADALLAWVTAAGDGFAANHSSGTFDPGIGLGTHLLWRRGRVLIPWLELAGAGWLDPQTAYATPGTASIVLPRIEITLALGLSFRTGP
jgi:hypothetical protein